MKIRVRLRKRKPEPTHKVMLCETRLGSRTIRLWTTGGQISFAATPDRIEINGKDYTAKARMQGWLDLDNP